MSHLPTNARRAALLAALAALCGTSALAAPPPPQSAARPVLMAHYMPWYQSKPVSGRWGWHWTMNHYDPDAAEAGGRQQAASHYRPLIGLYDSSDPDAVTCQALLMRMAGIQGVIFDWYGHDDVNDYAAINRNVLAMLPALRRAGLRFAVCYETRTITVEEQAGAIPPGGAVAHGVALLLWMQTHFFDQPGYLRVGDQPVLLNFGDPVYTADQWEQCFAPLPARPAWYTLRTRQDAPASIGAFDWPFPQIGMAASLQATRRFDNAVQAHTLPSAVASAYPRFNDIYAEAGSGQNLGSITDGDGATYTATLTQALASGAPVVQLVTWNDYGEGTQIEPTAEDGYRDLEITQRAARRLDPALAYTAADLRLPVAWYLAKKAAAGDAAEQKRLDAVPGLLIAGKVSQARAEMAALAPSRPAPR